MNLLCVTFLVKSGMLDSVDSHTGTRERCKDNSQNNTTTTTITNNNNNNSIKSNTKSNILLIIISNVRAKHTVNQVEHSVEFDFG